MAGMRNGKPFHLSRLEGLPAGLSYAWEVARGHGIDGERDGLRLHNLVAAYTHLRSAAGANWAPRFVAFVRACRAQRLAAAAAAGAVPEAA